MSLRFHWFLPTYGDSRNLMAGGHGSSMSGDRPATLKYLNQIGAAAETNGFEAVLTPTGAWCEDAWLTTAMMLETTETLKFLVALRPGLLSPTLAAQMAATFQWQSGGRLLLNVVTGGEDHEQRTFGDFLDKNQRYARCGEFLDVIRQLWSGNGPVDFSGEYVNVEKATLQRIPDPVPPIFFGGSSPAAGTVASRYADTYLTWGETPSAVAAKL
ncbi:MAG: LLM class flavin-dependent oxidoreductase, partial [Rhodococcus sp. (in: high G+C Gram-positive bacteria)]|nr:LLM class flavin-dependent oxidoreductase [Rhodococcus sp. (in: high G+C Gram-positive bacteria)]